MKLIASAWRSTRLIGFQGCKRSGLTPRRNSATNKSPAGLTHTRTASTARRLQGGGGRTGLNDLTGCKGWPARKEGGHHSLLQTEWTACERQRERILHECSNRNSHFPSTTRHGSDQYQYHSHACHGWCAGGKFGTPRNSDGDGTGGLLPVAAVPAIRSAGPRVAQPRSVRAVDGTRVYAALFFASLDPSPSGQQRL